MHSKDYEKWYQRYMMGIVNAEQLTILVEKGKLTESEKQEIIDTRLKIYKY